MLIYGLNDSCKNISDSYLKAWEESMSANRFQTTAKGNLTHLSYIFRKPETLGTEFKTVEYYVTREFLFIELNRGKEGIEMSPQN